MARVLAEQVQSYYKATIKLPLGWSTYLQPGGIFSCIDAWCIRYAHAAQGYARLACTCAHVRRPRCMPYTLS